MKAGKKFFSQYWKCWAFIRLLQQGDPAAAGEILWVLQSKRGEGTLDVKHGTG